MLLCLPPFSGLQKEVFTSFEVAHEKRQSMAVAAAHVIWCERYESRYFFRSIQNSPQYYLLMYYYTYKMHTLNSRSPSLSHLFLFSFFSFLRFWSLLVQYLSCIQSTLHRIVSTLVFHVSVNRSFLEGGNVATNVDSLQRNAGSSIKSRAQQRLKWRAIKVVAK